MTEEPPIWTRGEVLAEMGNAAIYARDDSARVQELPEALDLPEPEVADTGWESHIQTVCEPDRAELARLWWDALDNPGTVRSGRLRQLVDGVWRSRETKVLDLRHQNGVGVVLVATTDRGAADPPESTGSRSSTLAGPGGFAELDVARFERPVWILQALDGIGRVLATEGDVEEVFGRTADDLVGNTVLRFIHPDDHPAGVEMWSALLEEPGSSRSIRQRIVRPDSTVRWIESTVMNRLEVGGAGVVLSVSHDITERRTRERDLALRASTDPLTGLPNRAALDDALSTMFDSGPATVAFIDLDRFKEVNDRLGHQRGDEVLQAIAGRLASRLPPISRAEGAIVGRWGGDEFAMIGPGDCEDLFRRTIRETFADPISVGDDVWHPGCSFGFAHSSDHDDPEMLIRSADTAMYEAKERA